MGKKGSLTGYAIFFLIISAIVVIAGLLGVTPGTFLPERCTLGSDFRCNSMSIQPNEIVIELENNAGRHLQVVNITVQSEALGMRTGTEVCGLTIGNVRLAPRESHVFNVNAPSMPLGCTYNGTRIGKEIYNADVTYFFLDSRNLQRSARGELLITNP